VTEIVAITGSPLLFKAVNEGIFPVPLAARPIAGVLFTQLNVFPEPVKLIAVVAPPLITVWLETVFTVGNAFIVAFTRIFRLVAPAEVSTTLPDILPDGADAADRTYTALAFTVPPNWLSVTFFPYPVPAASDTSKPVGAVIDIFAVKPLPETVNCWIFGLAEAGPAQV